MKEKEFTIATNGDVALHQEEAPKRKKSKKEKKEKKDKKKKKKEPEAGSSVPLHTDLDPIESEDDDFVPIADEVQVGSLSENIFKKQSNEVAGDEDPDTKFEVMIPVTETMELTVPDVPNETQEESNKKDKKRKKKKKTKGAIDNSINGDSAGADSGSNDGYPLTASIKKRQATSSPPRVLSIESPRKKKDHEAVSPRKSSRKDAIPPPPLSPASPPKVSSSKVVSPASPEAPSPIKAPSISTQKRSTPTIEQNSLTPPRRYSSDAILSDSESEEGWSDDSGRTSDSELVGRLNMPKKTSAKTLIVQSAIDLDDEEDDSSTDEEFEQSALGSSPYLSMTKTSSNKSLGIEDLRQPRPPSPPQEEMPRRYSGTRDGSDIFKSHPGGVVGILGGDNSRERIYGNSRSPSDSGHHSEDAYYDDRRYGHDYSGQYNNGYDDRYEDGAYNDYGDGFDDEYDGDVPYGGDYDTPRRGKYDQRYRDPEKAGTHHDLEHTRSETTSWTSVQKRDRRTIFWLIIGLALTLIALAALTGGLVGSLVFAGNHSTPTAVPVAPTVAPKAATNAPVYHQNATAMETPIVSTKNPTRAPTNTPTLSLTHAPTKAPTTAPTVSPTSSPSKFPVVPPCSGFFC